MDRYYNFCYRSSVCVGARENRKPDQIVSVFAYVRMHIAQLCLGIYTYIYIYNIESCDQHQQSQLTDWLGQYITAPFCCLRSLNLLVSCDITTLNPMLHIHINIYFFSLSLPLSLAPLLSLYECKWIYTYTRIYVFTPKTGWISERVELLHRLQYK